MIEDNKNTLQLFDGGSKISKTSLKSLFLGLTNKPFDCDYSVERSPAELAERFCIQGLTWSLSYTVQTILALHRPPED